MAELRAELERELPAVPDARLCHNVRELLNGAKIQVEVQAVATSSVSNVLDAVKSHTDQVFASAEGMFEYACGTKTETEIISKGRLTWESELSDARGKL